MEKIIKELAGANMDIDLAVDRHTHKILNIIVTGNDVGDIKEFLPLVEPVEGMNDVKRETADGAYDS